MKKILFGLAVFFVLLIGVLFAVPYLFKDEITAQIKKAANESLHATLDFKDVDLSVFRHFPKLSVGLEGLDITGVGAFDGIKLVQCERLDVTVDLWSAIFGNQVDIKGLFFKRPDIRVYVLSDGSANYDITKPEDVTKPSATEEGSTIRLERYAIEDGKLLYDDRSLDMRAELLGLEHEGSGEFTADMYDLVMKTKLQQLSVNYGGVQYLSKARADWDATLGADMKNMRFTLKENNLKVNDLEVNLDGWVQMPEHTEDILMDLTFGTPANTFKSLLSIVPGAYTQDFKDVQANGSVQFAGFAKGTYNEKTYPAFKLDFKVGNADFKYPSLPLGVTNINVDASINSPSQRLNDMTVNIPAFSLKIGSNPLEGRFFLKTPESDPNVDMRLNGTLNLGELAKAFPMEGVQELTGIIKANMTIKAAMSQIDRQLYDQVQMAGDFAMTGINYRAEGTPPVTINSLSTSLTPQRVDIKNFDAKLGRSDLRASGSIDNILAYFSTTKTMRGNLVFTSNYFDANEWMEPAPADGSKAPADVPATATTTTATEKVFDRWDFTMDGKINRLKYDTYDLTNMDMTGHFTPNKMTISDFGMKIGASDLHGNGTILNAWDYLFDNRTVSGVINLRSMYFDANYFMTDAPAATAAPASKTAAVPPAEVMLVPENMNMTINAKFDKVKYTNLDLNNLDGQIIVKNGTARLRDCTAQVLGGQVGLNGEYNTTDAAKPAFNIDLALLNMGFKDAFQTFATVKALAPVAQLIDGKFNTTLSLSGLLGKDMTPDFSTLSAAGFIETLSAILNNFKPLNEISTKLNIPYLNNLELKNTKNWFEVKDGTVTVKPFDVQMRDVAMKIGGMHGLTNEMNYQIVTKAPRKLLGTAANSGLNFLSKEASKYGVSLAQGEFINVRFDLTGSLFSPKVAMKVLGSDGESTLKEEAGATLKATMDKATDSLRNVANRELDKGKQQAAAAAQKAADSLRVLADKKLKEVTDKATQEAKDKLGKEVGEKVGTEATKKAEEALGDKGTKSVEEAKKKLEGWDPFKKKKKDN